MLFSLSAEKQAGLAGSSCGLIQIKSPFENELLLI